MLIELTSTHPTEDAKRTVKMITKGQYSRLFYSMVLVSGNIVPLALLLLGGSTPIIMGISGLLVLVGIYITEHIWVEAPQRIPLT